MLKSPDKYDRWNPDMTYVIGHQRPDTDSIAAALGYAWYLTNIGQKNILAARAGQPGDQALFALKRFGLSAPRLLTGVAPTFGHAAVKQQSVLPNDSIPAAMARVAAGERVVPVVDTEGNAIGMVNSLALARAYTAPMNVTEMLAQPCSSITETSLTFFERDRISDHRGSLIRSETDDFLVVTETGAYVGVATRRIILQPPRAKLILVDHNELTQAVAGAEEAEIVGVLDHHRLGNPSTALPIPFLVDTVGSTSTLVAEHCLEQGLTPPADLAGILLSGVLSDTLVFRSPTTTDRDRTVVDWIAHLANVDFEAYGSELLNAAPGLDMRSAGEILDSDRKSYQMGGSTVSIAQVEVTGLQGIPARREELLAELKSRRQQEGLALIALMITDVVSGRSHLLCHGEKWILAALPYNRLEVGEYDLEEIVSRKKQLVPSIDAVFDEFR